MTSRARTAGFSLVEVLVALVVLSVGMLGVAVLFVQSIRNSRSAVFRTHAVNLVSDMADRIRANAAARLAYDTDEYSGTPTPQDCAPSAERPNDNCDPELLAQDDLARWQEAVRNTLPVLTDNTPMARVDYFPPASSTQPERYRIRVSWLEPATTPQESSSGEVHNYQSDVVLMPRR